MKRGWALVVLLALGALSACAGWRSGLSKERFPYGIWVVSRYVLPAENAAPASAAQAYLGKSVRFTQDWIDDPGQAQASCVPGAYRLYRRDLPQEDLFDGRAGNYSFKELGLAEPRAFEVKSFCEPSFYLSWDRTQLLLPRPGYLLVLEPVGRIHFERTPTPEPCRSPTPAVPKIGFEPRPTSTFGK
jgi:hypothetical protein